MKRVLIALFVVVLVLPSCSTARYFADFKVNDAFGDMALLGPASCQFYIDADENESYSDSLSVASEALVGSLTARMVPVNAVLPLDSLQREEAVAFMRYFALQPTKTAGTLPIPSDLDDLLEEADIRYGLLVYADGMTRNRKSVIKNAVLGAALGILTAIVTMGTVYLYTYADAYVSSVYVAVLDSETDRVVFYNCAANEEYNPLSERHVRAQLARVLRDFRY